MRTRTYRAKAFLRAASQVGIDVTVATEREQPLARLAPGTTLALDFSSARHAQDRIREFAADYPVEAVVGVDDDTTVLAAQLAAALGLPHNPVEAVKAARYKDVMRLALSEADGVLSLDRTLPNKVTLSATVTPGKDGVRMEFRVTNGSAEKLTGLRVQMCVMLASLTGFDTRTNEFVGRIGGFVGFTGSNDTSGPDGIVADGNILYAGNGDRGVEK